MKSTFFRQSVFGAFFLGCSVLTVPAEAIWDAPNVPDESTMAYFPFDGTLDPGTAAGGRFFKIEDLTNGRSPRNPAEPTFEPSQPKLGQALKLSGPLFLRSDYLKLPNAGELTLSFLAKLSEPGSLAWVGYSMGGGTPEDFIISLKALASGQLKCVNVIGAGKWVEKSEVCDVTDGGWHHIAITLKPKEDGSGSVIKIWVDGNAIMEFEREEVAGEKCFFVVGAHPNEFYMERGGPSAEMLMDEVLLTNRVAEQPNAPLK